MTPNNALYAIISFITIGVLFKFSQQGRYMITHGLDGFMMGHLTAGMSPVHHMIHAVPQVSSYLGDNGAVPTVQVMLMGVFRLISLFYLNQFDRIISSELR